MTRTSPVIDDFSYNIWNQYDEFGLLVNVKRTPGEKNWSYKRRIVDAFVNRSNSTYRGLVNSITRDLGLTLFQPLVISPKISISNSNFIAKDPYIKFDGVNIYLYSDYANETLEYTIDRYEAGGNYEHLSRLVDFINSSSYFEAGLISSDYNFTRSMTIINQSNRLEHVEEVQSSNKFKLKYDRLVSGKVRFEGDTNIFVNEQGWEAQVKSVGDYYINYLKGEISVYTVPPSGITIYYKYTDRLFKPYASPVILHDVNNDNFKVKMFEQVLQDNGTYTHGLPTVTGVDIINEIFSIVPMYWGV